MSHAGRSLPGGPVRFNCCSNCCCIPPGLYVSTAVLQVPTAVFCQPPLGTVGLTEEQAVEKLHGEVDVYVSKFKPMKNTLRWVGV